MNVSFKLTLAAFCTMTLAGITAGMLPEPLEDVAPRDAVAAAYATPVAGQQCTMLLDEQFHTRGH